MEKVLGLRVALLALIFGLSACHGQQQEKIEVMSDAPEQPKKTVEKTDEQWKKELSPQQYAILREAATERANGEVYKQFKKQGAGTYYCAGCNAELFSSETKFDSQCGWPSFYDPAKAKNVKTDTDYHLGYARTEVRCAVCDGHLGHVFAGESFASMGGKPTPTGQRYCINGTVLKFVPAGEAKEKKEAEQGKKTSKEVEKSEENKK